MNMRDVECYELVRCPRCKEHVNTEYLTYVTKTGEVVGCSCCVPRVVGAKAPVLRVLQGGR
jgi:hypothetical protein